MSRACPTLERPTYAITGQRGVLVCELCGALVMGRMVHDEWHARLWCRTASSTRYTSVICRRTPGGSRMPMGEPTTDKLGERGGGQRRRQGVRNFGMEVAVVIAEKCPECSRHVEPTPVGRFRFVCLCGKRWGDKEQR